jgi:hypothetical protein
MKRKKHSKKDGGSSWNRLKYLPRCTSTMRQRYSVRIANNKKAAEFQRLFSHAKRD